MCSTLCNVQLPKHETKIKKKKKHKSIEHKLFKYKINYNLVIVPTTNCSSIAPLK